jgi:hypothetical protein
MVQVKILSIAGGILSSLAFIGFLFIAGLYNSDIGLFILGIVLLIAGIWIDNQFKKIFLDTISVSLYLISYLLIGLGLGQLKQNESIIYLLFILLATVCLFINKNTVISLLSVLIIHGSILALLLSNDAYELLHLYIPALSIAAIYLFLNEVRFKQIGVKFSNLYAPVRSGMVLSFLSALFFLGKKGIFPISTHLNWVSSLVIIGCILYLLSRLSKQINKQGRQFHYGYFILVFFLLLPSIFSPAISGSLLILLLGFMVNYKTGFVLGIIGLLYYISQYYYDLNFNLLTKSILMMASGIMLLLAYFFINKQVLSDEKI